MRGLVATLAAFNCLRVVLADLGHFALQKVLDDGLEVFGNAQSNDSQNANWMASYPDSTPIVHLNIPGTHDTATWNYSQSTQDSLSYATRCDGVDILDPSIYRCQTASIAQSLQAGIRFFDLRYAFDPVDTRLVFWHAEALTSARATVEDVLYSFYAWLDSHPSETVILSFMYQGSTKANATNSAAVQQMLFGILTSDAATQYILQERGSLGTLGDARGKIILFRRFAMDQLPPEYDAALPGIQLPPSQWTDNGANITIVYNQSTDATAYIEDLYEPPGDNARDGIAAKLDAVKANLEKAAGGDPDGLFVTFTSATKPLNANSPITPEIFALGNGTEETPDGGVNEQLVPILEGHQAQRLGIVVMDFFGEPAGLIDQILGAGHVALKSQP
jgi:1-phosphatidylinositol phosphodiesterase